MAEEVWQLLEDMQLLPKDPVKKQALAKELVNLFKNHDADDWGVDDRYGLFRTANPDYNPEED